MNNKPIERRRSSSVTAVKSYYRVAQPSLSRLFLLTALLTLVVFAPAWAAGTQIVVCATGGDYTTIQAAVTAASSGDVITVCAGLYQENIVLRAGVSIQGAGSDTTIVDGGATQSVVRALTADIGASTMVSGLTLRNGRATSGGGVQVRQGAPAFKNLVIENNEAW
ncbi:MAG: hypothetical protein WBV59_18185, partial [Anaerolineae bacterium]